MLDISGFRARRRSDLTSLATETARRVAGSGQPERLSAMNPFERKVVHDVIAGVAGVRSESEGEDRKSTRLNSSHANIVCRLLLEKKKQKNFLNLTQAQLSLTGSYHTHK